MADSSFDIVSKADRQEVDNALNQAAKELSQRFDFRGTDATIEWAGEEAVTLSASTEERCKAAIEVFKEKLIKRGLSLKCRPWPLSKTMAAISIAPRSARAIAPIRNTDLCESAGILQKTNARLGLSLPVHA